MANNNELILQTAKKILDATGDIVAEEVRTALDSGSDSTGKTSAFKYFAALYKLNRNIKYRIWKTVFEIFADTAVEVFKEVYSVDGTESGLKKVLGSWLYKKISKSDIKDKIDEILSDFSDKTVSVALKSYEDATAAYEKLVDELNSATAKVSDIKSTLKNFTDAADNIQTSLKTLGVTIELETLPEFLTDSEIVYSDDKTAITLPADYEGELKTDDYKKTVKLIDAAAVTEDIIINGNTKDNTVHGGAGDDQIFGNGGKDLLYGAAGDDTLHGGKGNDILLGGSGNDIFVYSSGDGKDTVNDYVSGEDTIKIASGTIKSVTVSDSDVTFKIGSGSIKIKDALDKEITVVDATDNEIKYLNGEIVGNDVIETKTLTLTNYDKSSVTIDDDISIVDASKRTKAIKIFGNALDNTISGGKGNDYLTGGAGDDVFVYTAGKDTITDYAAGEDSIKISNGTIKSVTMSGSNVTFKVGDGSIKVKKALDKEITVVDANGNTNKYLNGEIVSPEENPSEVATYNGHSYKIFDNSMTWADAKAYCENLGGHLVVITDEDEQSFVENLLGGGTKNSYWLGGENVGGNWSWVTGEKFSYQNWGYLQPDGDGTALMAYRSEDNGWPLGDWNDVPADGNGIMGDEDFFATDKFGFICEWDNTGDIDALMSTANSGGGNLSGDSEKILNDVVFAQMSTKN